MFVGGIAVVTRGAVAVVTGIAVVIRIGWGLVAEGILVCLQLCDVDVRGGEEARNVRFFPRIAAWELLEKVVFVELLESWVGKGGYPAFEDECVVENWFIICVVKFA